LQVEHHRASQAASEAASTGSDDKAQEIENLEARLREADFSRNEAIRIQQSANEARQRLDGQLEEADKERRKLAARVTELDANHKRLEEYLASLKAERDEASTRAAELERMQEDSETRAKKLEMRALEAERRAASGAPAAAGGDSEPAGRVQKLEREKAEILLESKREIERLTREQDVLREELESAGEMIERLGKELELT
jgi:chromosome segregation ATPase